MLKEMRNNNNNFNHTKSAMRRYYLKSCIVEKKTSCAIAISRNTVY